MSKKRDKETVKANEWLTEWCNAHQAELEKYRGFVVIIHPERGILSSAREMSQLQAQSHSLKKKLLPDIAFIYTSDYIPPLDDKLEQQLTPLADPFENGDLVLDGSRPADAGDLNSEELGKLIKTELSGSAFPSPHAQPSFQPRPSNGREVLIDGGGASYRRGLTFD